MLVKVFDGDVKLGNFLGARSAGVAESRGSPHEDVNSPCT